MNSVLGARLLATLVVCCLAALSCASQQPEGQPVGSQQDEVDRLVETLLERHRSDQETLFSCMAEQGFEYVPRDPYERLTIWVPPTFDEPYGTLPWVRKYGLGITTTAYDQRNLPDDLTGGIYPAQPAADPDLINPNDAIVEALDDETRAAWEDSYGACTDALAAAAEAAEAAAVEANQKEAELERAFGADPRAQRIYDDIAKCMAEAGYDETPSSGDVGGPIQQRFSEFFTRNTESELRDTPDALAELREAQAYEREYALALWDCGWFTDVPADLRVISADYRN